jgi:hypothetical protein
MNTWSLGSGRRSNLESRLVVAKETVRSLLFRIQEIEVATQLSDNEKLSKIKMIKEEMIKVGMEIDNIKKEITLLNTYHVN